MIASDELTKRLFIWGVVAVAVIPRHHIDRSRWTIGGDLSNSFRKLLLFLTVSNLIRLLCSIKGRQRHLRFLSDALGIVEVIGLTLLSFLTPYLLQTWLVGRIALPGGGRRPGASLMQPLYLTCILSVAGVVLSHTVNSNLWCFKKLANVASGPPVLETLKVYNTLISVGGHHNGRGNMISQSLVVVEYWHIATQLLCAIGYALDRHMEMDAYTQWDYLLEAFRAISFVSDWTRVLAHAIFMNILDELFLTGISSSGPPGPGNNNNDPSNDEENRKPSSELVSVGAGGRTARRGLSTGLSTSSFLD
jgi:hypothetical protein